MTPERIRAIPLFSTLSESELATVAAAAGELEAAPETILAAEGDFGHSFFAVESGEAEVFRGEERIGTLRPGDVFGEIALLSSGRRTASVVAVTQMRLITLFKRDLWQIEKTMPALADALRATVRARLEQTSGTT